MRWVVVLTVLFSGSCRTYMFQQQQSGQVDALKKEVTINVPSESDILFVLDNSGSMGEEIDNMRCNVQAFVQALSAGDNKFRVAVTTTDNQDQTGGNCDSPPGLSASVDPKHHGRCGHFLAPAGKAGFLKREDFATPAAMAAEFTTYLARDNSTISTGGSAVEQPIKSAVRALDPALSMPGGPNEGFFREDALLVIILVTDESDCSFDDDKASTFSTASHPLEPGFECYSQAPDLTPVETWAQRVIDFKKGDRSLVSVGVISGSARDSAGVLHPGGCRLTPDRTSATDECACFYLNPTNYCSFTKQSTPTVGAAGTCGIPGTMSAPTNMCPAVPPANSGEGNCCTALGNDRLFGFANQFENRKDTICQTDFTQTLLVLAQLADRQCFSLEKAPLNDDPNNVQLKLRRKDEKDFVVIPLTDGEAGDGWYYQHKAEPTACLAGSYKRKSGDTLSLFVVTDLQGSTEAGMQ